MRYAGQAANTLNFEFVWFRLKPGWPSGCFLKKLGSTVSLFPRVYFIHGEWQATILNRIEWKRNPPPKKSKVKSCCFPTLDFNGREGGINSEYIYRCLSSGKEHLPEQNQTSSLLINTAKCSNPKEHECISTWDGPRVSCKRISHSFLE